MMPVMEMDMDIKAAQTARETREPEQSASPLEMQNLRLQALVSEMILDNQGLRFKVAQLEAELEKNERSLKASTAWAGMLF